mmetsp:Transcript_9052/g.27203  ORF Transcript_9052/g.27203 Transcript_9052/m.27203 type:complete len:133 (+) Transcript_9052:248-646(+)|eukprot:CAMPEP_0198724802 /NCGR_PEP_ID=MMETSP1475-20131203/2213_1 /TAXON_ID= ORGANISM="Unidentified sp., Strain CCMP1999" /NCGR_SAMPLE_ID=MMETSP1475 /ASSEMBLY_ACC=CAM_ASM_001111 /LENGTH=132 /DNA_ID=CAMNT_0044486427 /DNA_START=216 /DNA_END=614 /DNA_ORIENTATION=+
MAESRKTEQKVLEKVRPLLEPHSSPLSQLPNPMTIYLAEVVFVLFLHFVFPRALKTVFFRIFLVPTLLATTVLYFFWSMNELDRQARGVRLLEKKEKAINKQEATVEETVQNVSNLKAEMAGLLQQLNGSAR